MNDQVQENVNEVAEVAEVAETDVTALAKAKAKALATIKKAYFPMAKLAEAQTTIDAMNAVCWRV